MKKLYLGISTKILVLILSTSLFIGIGYSGISLYRLQQEITDFQQAAAQRGQLQLTINHAMFTKQVRTWLETLADLTQLNQQTDFEQFSSALKQQADTLAFNFNVNHIWLVNQQHQLLFASQKLPSYVQKHLSQVFEQQQPDSQIICFEQCEQFIYVPVLNAKAEIALVIISASLVDILYDINQAIDSDVDILKLPRNQNLSLSSAEIISASNIKLTEKILEQSRQNNANLTVQQGLNIHVDDKDYLISVAPLFENSNSVYFLALIDDITEFVNQRNHYRQQLLLAMFATFLLLGLLTRWLMYPYTNRLLKLTGAMPLLAQKKFEQFKQVELKRSSIFHDELDTLVEASNRLANELDMLNREVEQKTKELHNIAMFDLLTGLPNRNMFNYQLRKSIANMALMNHHLAILFIDLDDFKKVNDSHGHGEGDLLLVQAAKRLRASVRTVDLVARFGGDEFVLIIEQLTNQAQAEQVAIEILKQFEQPIKIDQSLFYITPSIGLAYCEQKIDKVEDLIRHADIAMYEAKAQGGNCYFVYEDEMYQRVAQRVMIEEEVRKALLQQQFQLSLQPQIAADDHRVVGFEALLRWYHPERGLISPDDFIPVLENSSYMIELGYWVIRRCFELLTQLDQQGLKQVRISINLSAIQFSDINLVGYLTQLLSEFALPANRFELELTEQTLIKDVDYAIKLMTQLKTLGFSFAIDDYGTGYSSLSYIKRLPVDVIKIDKSFVFGMLENHADYQIIMSTISMVKNLGLIAVAEGVETSAQLHALAEHGCDLIQGYYFSKPIAEDELEEVINEKVSDHYWKSAVKVDLEQN